MRTAIAPTVVFSLVALVTAAHADPRHELSIGGIARALRSPSANALTAHNLGGAAFGVARDLGLPLGPAALWVEAGAATGSVDGTMFQNLSTEIDTLDVTGGLRARYALHRLVFASARIDLGAQRVRLGIDGAGTSTSDHGWGGVASAAVALDMTTPPGRGALGIRVEAGYVIAQAISLSPHRSVSDDVLMLEMTDAGLGKLDLGGPTLSASLIGQF